MKMNDTLAILQAERRAQALKNMSTHAQMRTGWIHYMRRILGMKLKDVARRSGISVSTVAQSERREAEGKVTLETLKKTANAMGCDLVYAFVPRKKIRALVEESAMEKAKRILANADTHMTLEDQKVTAPSKERIERLAEKLIQKRDVW